jgi:hypothetical protein
MNTKLLTWWLFAIAISPLAYFPFSHWLAVAPYGTGLCLWIGTFVFEILVLIALLMTPILLFRLLVRSERKQAVIYLAASMLLIVSCGGGIILGLHIHMAGIRSWATKARPLILAIHKYEREHSTPPPNLESLVPNYLPEIPTTGMAAYPVFSFHTGDDAQQEYFNNPWAVSILTPTSFLNFDELLYFPQQNYPEVGYGGWLERIGNWAYVHE